MFVDSDLSAVAFVTVNLDLDISFRGNVRNLVKKSGSHYPTFH